VNPTGPDTGDQRVRRGGSYLCHDSYCNRYRVSARDHSAEHDTSGNIGFRCASSTNPG
jgi:sulfatase modifying factor 1